jgi:outer membrane lipoprotein
MLTMLMTACSSSIPVEIRQSPANAPDLAQVREQPGGYVAQPVRWGGMILETENTQNASRLTIIAFPLSDNGQPQTSAQSPGRFIAIVDKFLEPLVYSRDRLITVTCNFFKTETLKIGEYPYVYPLVEVDHYYLWPEKRVPYYTDYPPYWRYDPWYYPGYPWHYPPNYLVPRHR